MFSHGSAGWATATAGSSSNNAEAIQPQRLELTLNPADGSLQAAPLTHVLIAATDGLYSDLHNMAHGELDVITTTAQQTADEAGDNAGGANEQEENATQQNGGIQQQKTKRERMSNLSFAQRRHELAWRLAQHGKTIQHVAALTAAAASTDLSQAVAISSTALQHARTAWVQADEAQDALYFFHAQLFPARAAPHDVYGALDVQLAGRWHELPTDLRLTVDRYETSRENEYSKQEVDERWQITVRDKLLRGEVGWMRMKEHCQWRQQGRRPRQPLWRVSLRGGIVRLTHGKPKTLGSDSKPCYPIECLLTVMSTNKDPEWTLLSVEVRVNAKTGEFNHQLETSNRQRYDLHRLCALAMAREEARVRRVKSQKGSTSKDPTGAVSGTVDRNADECADDGSSAEIARPLNSLFQVTHTFSLSWQLEMLSAQAQALRRGVWAAGQSNPVNVTPVHFFNDPSKSADTGTASSSVFGVVSISFWKVDDSYGPPSMGDLTLDDEWSPAEQNQNSDKKSAGFRNYATTTSQLSLSIRAESNEGIRVSLSGADSIMDAVRSDPHVKSTVEELLEAASSPFALSVSDALLAATRLCAERKCYAAVAALQPTDMKSFNRILPEWMLLAVERGSIVVAARISYHGIDNRNGIDTNALGMPILFRLMCDARTGSFVNTFPRSAQLLRQLACNDSRASEAMSLRTAHLPPNRRRAAGANSSGRVVREAFDGLVRSMNVLGQRAGVGGKWDNIDDKSVSLRERSIQAASADVRLSLVKCCGMAALYGIAPLALGVAFGLDALTDIAGETIESIDGHSFLHAPPVSIMMDQKLIETSTTTSDGIAKKAAHLEQSLFGIVGGVSDKALSLYPFEISTKLDTPSSVPQRLSSSLLEFSPPAAMEDEVENDVPPAKRRKQIAVEHDCRAEDLTGEVKRFSDILSSTVDSTQTNEPELRLGHEI